MKQTLNNIGINYDLIETNNYKKGSIISYTANITQKIIEKKSFIDWGSPNEKDKEYLNYIEENEPKLFEQLKGNIQFELDTIVVDGLKFDRKPLSGKFSYENANDKANEIEGRRLPTKEEYEKLFDLFRVDGYYNSKYCKDLLSIKTYSFWHYTNIVDNEIFMGYVCFGDGFVGKFNKSVYIKALCIYD